MRRTLIQFIMPLALCVVPILAGVLIAFAIPEKAMAFYLKQLKTSRMDWLIVGLGAILFVSQLILGWRALRWRNDGFDQRPDKWLSNLAQAAEWFPLLGLLGTVGGILLTFSEMTGQLTPSEIIKHYAPAITATGSGLFMALINILPTWLVGFGRDLILSLSGAEPAKGG